MTVLIDYSQRLYLMVSNRDGVVKFLERGSGGSDLIRRKQSEVEGIGIRSLPAEEADRMFSIVENISGGELVKRWTRDGLWAVSAEARLVIDRVVWLEDMVEWLKYRAELRTRSVGMILDRAKQMREASKCEMSTLEPAASAERPSRAMEARSKKRPTESATTASTTSAFSLARPKKKQKREKHGASKGSRASKIAC